MVGEGCCTGGDEVVGALLPERGLVFLDVAFLGCIEVVSLLIAPIYCCKISA